jgi:hypothetical protein
MGCDRIMLPVSVQTAVAMIVAAWFTIAAGDVHAQPAPGIVVTSPHVWQPGGSAPPYGVHVLPGGSAELTLVFENRGGETVARYEASLPAREDRPDVTVHYPTDPSVDPRCGVLERIPNNSAFGGGYRYAVGPIPPGMTLTCSWRIRRIADGADLALRGPGVPNQFILIGTIPDLDIRFEQLTPMIAGVSSSALFRMTVANPSVVSLVATPTWGACSESGGMGMEFRPDGPEPCQRGLFVCFGGIASVSVGSVPAGQQRQCTFSIWYAQPRTRVGTLQVPGRFESLGLGSAAGGVYDPNPSNSSTGPVLTVSAEGVPAFGGLLALALTLTLFMGFGVAAAWFRLRF